jgi:hypothetical protein
VKPVNCEHWRDCGIVGGGCCAIGRYNRPSHGVCDVCLKVPVRPPAPPASKGLGDTLARLFERTGVGALAKRYERLRGKPCGCKKRQAALNRLVPYLAADQEPL